jgi:hypothetical protein
MSGNLLVRFDEGRVGRAEVSPSLLPGFCNELARLLTQGGRAPRYGVDVLSAIRYV